MQKMNKQEVAQVLEWFSEMGVSDILNTDPVRPSNKQISSLAELKEAMAKVDISIKHCATNMVFGTGNEKADILLLGEAPGADISLREMTPMGVFKKLLTDKGYAPDSEVWAELLATFQEALTALGDEDANAGK